MLNNEAVFLGEGFSFLEQMIAEMRLLFFAFEIVLAERVGGEETVVAGVPPGWVAEVVGVIHESDDGRFSFRIGTVVGDPLGAFAPSGAVFVAFGVFNGALGDLALETEGGSEAKAERPFLGVAEGDVLERGESGGEIDDEILFTHGKRIAALFVEEGFTVVFPSEVGGEGIFGDVAVGFQDDV